ncbi:DNA cytosine methyltransferase [beta proteobacterium MWH-UniP1]
MTNRTKFEVTRGRPIGIDLFAGAGGMSLGFEQAGFDIVAAVEIDPIHCAVHEYNFPYCKTICASVTDLTGTQIRALAGIGDKEIDVVFGGAPCQGFSLIGKRALDDPRNSLVYHYVRIVKQLSPKYFVFENVKGLTVGKHRQFLLEIIEALGRAGYDVLADYKVLNAADFEVPQDRKRLFLLGARKGQKLPAYPKPTGSVTVAEAILDLPNADDFPQLLATDTVKVRYKSKSVYSKQMRGEITENLDFSYLRQFDPNLLTSSFRTEHTDISRSRFSKTEPGKVEPVSRFLKLDPSGVCNTLRAGTGSDRGAFTSPRPIHPNYPRVITVREAARLHSYPDWFRFHITKWHGFRQIGNSVPPRLGRAVASSIISALGRKPSKPSRVLNTGDEALLTFVMSEAAEFYTVSKTVIPQRQRKISSGATSG